MARLRPANRAAALMLAIAAGTGYSQTQQTPPPPVAKNAAIAHLAPTQMTPEERRKAERNELRRKKLMEQVATLQALTTELRREVAKTDKDMLSLDVVRRSQQVEEQAKNIHSLMTTQE